MLRSSRSIAALAMLVYAISGCATRNKHPPPPSMLSTTRLGSLRLALGIEPIAVTKLPPRFRLDPYFTPLWWGQGAEIAIAGTVDSRPLLLGLSGPAYDRLRVLGGEDGAQTRNEQLLDAAASPDGMALVLAYADPGADRTTIIDRDYLDAGPGRPAMSFHGASEFAQLSWIGSDTIAIVTSGRDTGAPALQLVSLGAQPHAHTLDKIDCPVTGLSFSPDGSSALAQGDAITPPYLIDLRNQTCTTIGLREPIRVLGWAPDSQGFLYIAHGAPDVNGVFHYDRHDGHSAVLAISSGAAAYTRDGTMIALGNSMMTWREASEAPDKPVHLEIARREPGQSEIQINSLGIATTPAMLGRASMHLSRASDNSIVDLEIPAPGGSQRVLLDYSYASRRAALIASGDPDAPLAMSWSPDGKLLAIVDGSVNPNLLTVLVPPR